MQELGRDMEDLLRKASANYPLKQTGDRWDEIASKIAAGPIPNASIQKKTSWNKKYLATSLLLIFFLFAGIVILKDLEPRRIREKDLAAETGKLPNVGQNSTKHLSVNTNDRMVNDRVKPDADNDFPGNIKGHPDKKNFVENSSKHVPLARSTMRLKQKGRDTESYSEGDRTPVRHLDGNTDVLRGIEMKPYRNEISIVPHVMPPDAGNHLALLTLNPKEDANDLLLGNRLYYGLIAGPGFNTIKNQHLTKAGLNIGILAGYQFTPSISIEAGLLLSQKFYSTTGDHFSMKIIGPTMPPGMQVMTIDGNTTVIEMPLQVRYNISQNNKRRFFSLAGISSFIIDRERNQYHTSMNGTEAMVYGTYKHNQGYFASSINLGIGYEQSIGKKSTIRVQPYLQLPLKGIGVGDLHVMSTGLFIGISRTAH